MNSGAIADRTLSLKQKDHCGSLSIQTHWEQLQLGRDLLTKVEKFCGFSNLKTAIAYRTNHVHCRMNTVHEG